MPLNLEIHNPVGHEVVVSTRKVRKVHTAKYRAVSLGGQYKMYDNHHVESQDLLLTLTKCSAINTVKVFGLIHQCYNQDTGLSVLSHNTTQTERNSISKAYKELSSLGLVKRVKRGVYMINPRMYINFEQYESLCLLWDSL